jgi:hypothetical protein
MKEVSGYGGLYYVTEDGRVWSCRRKKWLVPTHHRGRSQVNLCVGGKPKCWPVHRLVAIAYVPNPDGKETVNHIDGNKQNNHFSNLEWLTSRENLLHGFKNGLMKPGADNNNKLQPSDVAKIKKLLGSGVAILEVAKQFGVARRTIQSIKGGESWLKVNPA